MIAFTAWGTVANAQESDYHKEVRTMLEATNAKLTFVTTLKTQLAVVMQKLNFTDAQVASLCDEIGDAIYDDMVDAATNIYEKHFSLKELKAINKFYKTPAGKKSAELTPQLTQEMISEVTNNSEIVTKLQSIIMKSVLQNSLNNSDDEVELLETE